MTMTAADAYDDCITQARNGGRRQQERADGEPDQILRELHKAAATTLLTFADMLVEMKKIRCP